MRSVLLVLALMAFTSCTSLSEAPPKDGGYDLKVTNHHPDDVVVYLFRGQRQRLGRVGGITGKRTWHLTRGQVRSAPQVLVCVGNYRPGGTCFLTDHMTGGYPGDWGETGVVLLTVMRGVDGIAAILNG